MVIGQCHNQKCVKIQQIINNLTKIYFNLLFKQWVTHNKIPKLSLKF